MGKIKGNIISILDNKKYETRFIERKQKYTLIANYVPDSYEKIICDNDPWFCHGLAFRMATFSDEYEQVFLRLNSLLKLSENLEGWKNESKNTGITWAVNYDEFFQHVWMLQCVEYFFEKGNKVKFPGRQGKKSPDLKITTDNCDEFFVECYVYSKWWFIELFLEHVIQLIDPNLSLERTYNIKLDGAKDNFHQILEKIGEATEPSSLEEARKIASKESPHIIYNEKGLKLLIYGNGEYQPDLDNAHGDPSLSANVYLNEIIGNKENNNDLAVHRPNRLMVNGLGYDFQRIFFSNRVKDLSFKSNNIDKLIINACGIDEQLTDCSRSLTINKD